MGIGRVSNRAPAFTCPRLLRTEDAAAYLGLGRTKFLELVEAGQIARPKRQGGAVTWDVRDLDAYADALPRDGDVIPMRRSPVAI